MGVGGQKKRSEQALEILELHMQGSPSLMTTCSATVTVQS